MGGDGSKSSFWTSLPGVLTGVAALIAAIGGIIALAVNVGVGRSNPTPAAQVTLAEWARQANEICSTAHSAIQSLGVRSDPTSQLDALPRTTPIVERANQQLEALNRPPESERQIRQILSLASQSNVALNTGYQWWRAGYSSKARAYARQAAQLGAALSRIDAEVGANICTEP